MKHPTNFDPVLAHELANLRYDTLAKFLELFSKEIIVDAQKDKERGREKLAEALFVMGEFLAASGAQALDAWDICESRMKEDGSC